MSGERTCVTNSLEKVPRADRPRPCLSRVRDETTGRMVPAHYAVCVDPDTCRGCVPREAEPDSYLCRACRAKVDDALNRVGGLILHLRSITKASQALGERVDTSAANRIILPESWLAADGLLEALGSPPVASTTDLIHDRDYRELNAHVQEALDGWLDVDSIVNTREGAKRAVVLVRRMQTALARYPDSEVDWRRVPLILCPGCSQATLYRKGPLHYADDLLIECAGSNLMYEQGIGYDTCEWRMDWFKFLDDYQRPIEAFFAIHRKAAA